MPRRDMKKMQDKRIWERMGRELVALNNLICHISTDREYAAVMDCQTWDRFDKMLYHLIQIRGKAEDRMARYIPDWDTQIFYPRDQEDLEAAIMVFRNSMKEGRPHD